MALSDDENSKLLDWVNGVREDGEQRRKSYEAQWYENMATYHGDLWSEFDMSLSQLQAPAKPDHRVRVPVNLAQPAIRTEYAKLLKNRPIVDPLARSNDRADLNAAEVADKILNNYVEKTFAMPKHRRQMLQWMLLCGSGGMFVDYDARAQGEQEVLVGPNGEPVFDKATIGAIQRYYRNKHKAPRTMKIPAGELRIRALSPFQYIYDFSTTHTDDAGWCIISEMYDVREVKRRWGADVEADTNLNNPGVMQKRMIARYNVTGNSVSWVGAPGSGVSASQKMAIVHRMFMRPGFDPAFPDGAEICFTNDQLIASYKYPFGHDMLPIATCGHVPAPGAQYQSSVLPQIKPLVLEISKTESQLIENRNLMANPIWLEFRQNRIPGEIQNRPGGRIMIEWMPNVPEPHPIEMPEMPSYMQNLIPTLKEHVLEVTGQSEVSQGKVPSGARAGVTIAYLQEEDDTKLGPTVQEYEECIERTAWLILETIAEKYDVPRTVRIFKRHSDPEVFDFVGTMLTGVAGVQVQAGSALPRSKAAKQQFILDLWDRKLEQDPRKVREMLELGNGDPDEWEVDVAQADRENRKMMGGEIVVAQEWHNHAAHHYEHRQYMKSAEWEELSREIQQNFLDHDEEHTQFEREQAQEQMVQQMMAGGGGQGGQPSQPVAPGANGQTNVADPQAMGQQPPANLQDLQPQ